MSQAGECWGKRMLQIGNNVTCRKCSVGKCSGRKNVIGKLNDSAEELSNKKIVIDTISL
jgi:hypothetical protein